MEKTSSDENEDSGRFLSFRKGTAKRRKGTSKSKGFNTTELYGSTINRE
jgi:hypothetical protein